MGDEHIEGVTQDLDAWWKWIWEELQDAARTERDGGRQKKTAFHQPVVANRTESGVECRMVVLREADEEARILRFHTDARSPKVGQFARHDELAWTFYDPGLKLQVKVRSRARVHHDDEVTAKAWEATRLFSRRCYLAPMAPGTEVDAPTSGLPPEFESRQPSEEESAPGYEAFAVVRAEVLEVDAMSLAYSGHRRARWTWDAATNRWRGMWLVP